MTSKHRESIKPGLTACFRAGSCTTRPSCRLGAMLGKAALGVALLGPLPLALASDEIITFSKAAAAYRQADYDQAIAGFSALANRGDNNAQYLLGLIYRDGRGAPQNTALAHRWLASAAQAGHTAAMATWGAMLLKMPSPPATRRQAIDMLERAANAGDAGAQLALAQELDHQPEDQARQRKAFRWYLLAAENGVVEAQKRLADLLLRGIGVPLNVARGNYWLQRAAERGDRTAQRRLGMIYERGDGVKADMATAMKWYERAAAQADPWTQFNLATMYEHGRGVPRDHVKALSWYLLAQRYATATTGPWQIDKISANLRQRMSAHDIKRAENLADAWVPVDERPANQASLSQN